jgi:radical SAM protein with 4Fe4S-binding SPASM domain
MEQKWLRHAVKEMRSIKSLHDLRYLNQKLVFLLNRSRGDFIKGTAVPPALQMEPTNNCNLSCTCCSGYSNTRRRGYMDFGLFCRIVDEAADIGVKRIHLYLHGEPLLHRQIGEMIRHIKSREMAVTLATNAMLLRMKKIADIMRSGLTSADYILLSVLGYSKETHERIMRGVDHERVTGNILRLIEYRNVHGLKGPLIETLFFRSADNEREEKQYVEHWKRIVDNARVAPAAEQYATFREGGLRRSVRTRTCNQLWERMTVYWNGDVALCQADIDGDYLLGNLKEQSITEIWNGGKVTLTRDAHRRSDFEAFPMCAACDW